MARERQVAVMSKLKPWVMPVWRRTSLFYVTVLATLCIKRLRSTVEYVGAVEKTSNIIQHLMQLVSFN